MIIFDLKCAQLPLVVALVNGGQSRARIAVRPEHRVVHFERPQDSIHHERIERLSRSDFDDAAQDRRAFAVAKARARILHQRRPGDVDDELRQANRA